MKLAMLRFVGISMIILTSCNNGVGGNQTVVPPTENIQTVTPSPVARSEFVSPYAGKYVTQRSERRSISFYSQQDIFTIHSTKDLEEHFLETRFNYRLPERDKQLLELWDDDFFAHNYLVITAPLFDQRDGRFGGILEDGRVVFYSNPPSSSEYATTTDWQSYSHLIALSNDFRPDAFEWVWVRRE